MREKIWGKRSSFSSKTETSMRLNRLVRDMMRLDRINFGDYLENKYIEDFKLKHGKDNIPDKMRDLWLEYWTLVKEEAEKNLKLYQPVKILSENEVFDILNNSFNQDRESVKIWYVKMKKGQSYLPDIFSSINGNHPEITDQVLHKHQKIAKMIIESIASEEGIA